RKARPGAAGQRRARRGRRFFGRGALFPFPFVGLGRGDDTTVIVLPPPPDAGPVETAPPPEPMPLAVPKRARVDGRAGLAAAPAVEVTVGAEGASVQTVAAALRDKRQQLEGALALAGLAFCLDPVDNLQIAQATPREAFTGRQILALRVADPDALLALLATLDASAVSGISVGDPAPVDAADRAAALPVAAPGPQRRRPPTAC
ncbi:MAG: hypothetical protein AAF677_08310, partial [Pseudomonadota bacterium]